MPLTPQELARHLAKHIDVTSLDAAVYAELAACINAALQEIWDVAPTAFRFTRIGVEVKAPVPVTLDLENGSYAISAFTGYASWMDGCSIQIDGMEEMNELVDGVTLLLPYSGPTATSVSATVYSDSITPDGGVISVVDPIIIAGYGVLRPAESFVEFEAVRQTRRQGVPSACWVDTYAFQNPSGLALRLRLYPLPDRALRLTYGARMNLSYVTASDLESSDPVPPFPIPGGWVESVLLPLAVQRLSLHPDFVAENLKTELPRQITAAHRILRGANPRRKSGTMNLVFR